MKKGKFFYPDQEDEDGRIERPNRTQLKKEALRVTAWVKKAVKLSPRKLSKLPIEEDIRFQIERFPHIPSRIAADRQIKYIASLIREHGSYDELLEVDFRTL